MNIEVKSRETTFSIYEHKSNRWVAWVESVDGKPPSTGIYFRRFYADTQEEAENDLKEYYKI